MYIGCGMLFIFNTEGDGMRNFSMTTIGVVEPVGVEGLRFL